MLSVSRRKVPTGMGYGIVHYVLYGDARGKYTMKWSFRSYLPFTADEWASP